MVIVARYLKVINRVVPPTEPFGDQKFPEAIKLLPVEMWRWIRIQLIEPLDNHSIDEPIELSANAACAGKM